MSLIDDTYFVRDLALPYDKYSAFQSYIDRYESELIYKLFGYALGKEILAYNALTSTQRIKDIVEGKEYIPNGSEYPIKWNGLINDQKVSVIAYYVAYCWFSENEVATTNSGAHYSKLENGDNVSHGMRAVQAWNKMIYLYGYNYQWLMQPSALNFMIQFKDDYPEFNFTHLFTKNSLYL